MLLFTISCPALTLEKRRQVCAGAVYPSSADKLSAHECLLESTLAALAIRSQTAAAGVSAAVQMEGDKKGAASSSDRVLAVL